MKPGKVITVGVPLVVTGCFLVLCWLGWQRVIAEQAKEVGYTEQERRQLAAVLTPPKPVVLWERVEVDPPEDSHVIYDSNKRAELLGLVFNATPESSGASKGRRL